MNCWPMTCLPWHCLHGDLVKYFSAKVEGARAIADSASALGSKLEITPGEDYPLPYEDDQLHWFFQESQVSVQQTETTEEKLVVRTISGMEVAALSPRNSENTLALKHRIQEQEGTSVFIQQLVQEGRILQDRDIVGKEPLFMVRMPKKMMLIASLHSDLRAYDLESGEAMRVVPVRSLRLSCILANWESARCFTGSADGAVRVWDCNSCECLGVLTGLQGKISALSSDQQDRLIATSEAGTLRVYEIKELGSGQVITKKSQEWQIAVHNRVALSVDWDRSLALVSGESKKENFHQVVAYDLQKDTSCKRLWSWRLFGANPTLEVDWATSQCITVPGSKFIELRGIESKAQQTPKQFAHSRLNRKGLLSVDWANSRVLFIAKPFALELWSLTSCQMMLSIKDYSLEIVENISLDVDWSLSVPRAITCRTYIDWELVAGEVFIQHWDIEEKGEQKSVTASHPWIGGFDIQAAVAQL